MPQSLLRKNTRLVGGGAPRPDRPFLATELPPLSGFGAALSEFFLVIVNNLTTMLFIVIGLVLLRVVLRRTWLVVGLAWLLMTALYGGSYPYMGWLVMGLWEAAFLFVFFRVGWLAIAVGFVAFDLLQSTSLTADPSAWHAYTTILFVTFIVALAVASFKTSLAGRPLFGGLLAEDQD